MEWYWYYLIVGVFVSFSMYATSIRYKIKNVTFIRRNPLLTWNILWHFPMCVLIWWFIVLGGCYEIMRASHLQQKVLQLREEVKQLKEQVNEDS